MHKFNQISSILFLNNLPIYIYIRVFSDLYLRGLIQEKFVEEDSTICQNQVSHFVE